MPIVQNSNLSNTPTVYTNYSYKATHEDPKTKNITPQFYKYDKDSKQNLLAGDTLQGHVTSVILQDPKSGVSSKTGAPYTIHNLEIKLEACSDGIKYIDTLQLGWGDSITEDFIGKLLGASSLNNVALNVFKYQAKTASKPSNYCSIKIGGIAGEKVVSKFISDEKYRANQSQVIKPKRTWEKREGKTILTTTVYSEAYKNAEGKVTLDDEYVVANDNFFRNAVLEINSKCTPFVFSQDNVLENIVKQVPQEPVEISYSVPTTENLPEVDLSEINVQMPF